MIHILYKVQSVQGNIDVCETHELEGFFFSFQQAKRKESRGKKSVFTQTPAHSLHKHMKTHTHTNIHTHTHTYFVPQQ